MYITIESNWLFSNPFTLIEFDIHQYKLNNYSNLNAILKFSPLPPNRTVINIFVKLIIIDSFTKTLTLSPDFFWFELSREWLSERSVCLSLSLLSCFEWLSECHLSHRSNTTGAWKRYCWWLHWKTLLKIDYCWLQQYYTDDEGVRKSSWDNNVMWPKTLDAQYWLDQRRCNWLDEAIRLINSKISSGNSQWRLFNSSLYVNRIWTNVYIIDWGNQ